MQNLRCKVFSFLVGVFFTFFLPLISSSHFDVGVGEDYMPMQHLTRAELSEVAGYGEERLSYVLVTGTVVCGYHDSHAIAGAKVAVVCTEAEGKRKRISMARETTDEFGDFIVDLPSQLHGIPQLHEACTIRVLQIPKNSLCERLYYGSKSKGIRLSSVGNSIRVYTAGVINVNHQRRPHHCLKGSKSRTR